MANETVTKVIEWLQVGVDEASARFEETDYYEDMHYMEQGSLMIEELKHANEAGTWD